MSTHQSNTGNLANMKCKPCTGTTPPLRAEQIGLKLEQLDDWVLQGQAISKTFVFKNYFQTISFVNAVAWISNQQDHHPELAVSYSKCSVLFTTHAINGLTENDFICAAKVDALFTT